jgi:hypothetical protein
MNPTNRALDLKSDMSLFQIHHTDYNLYNSLLDIDRLVSDMSQCFIFTESPYLFYVKEKINNRWIIAIIEEKEIKSILKKIVIGDFIIDEKQYKSLNLWQFFNLYLSNEKIDIKQHFCYEQVCFHSTSPNTFSLFRGFSFTNLGSYCLPTIEPFFNHVRSIICTD